MNKSWIITLEKDPETGDLILPLNDDILEGLDCEVGDTIEWIDNKDGSWTMRKKEELEWVLVECVSTFRERYMVQVPKGKSEWALDTVTMNEAKEFSQEHLGEQIISHRVIGADEALELCDKDNQYCGKWATDKKLEAFFTTWEEQNDTTR
jgi:hypothetical protein